MRVFFFFSQSQTLVARQRSHKIDAERRRAKRRGTGRRAGIAAADEAHFRVHSGRGRCDERRFIAKSECGVTRTISVQPKRERFITERIQTKTH